MCIRDSSNTISLSISLCSVDTNVSNCANTISCEQLPHPARCLGVAASPCWVRQQPQTDLGVDGDDLAIALDVWTVCCSKAQLAVCQAWTVCSAIELGHRLWQLGLRYNKRGHNNKWAWAERTAVQQTGASHQWQLHPTNGNYIRPMEHFTR